MTMAEKRPYPDGQGPNGDAKRAKGSDAVEAAKAKAKAKANATGHGYCHARVHSM